jgi:hypothetical protein
MLRPLVSAVRILCTSRTSTTLSVLPAKRINDVHLLSLHDTLHIVKEPDIQMRGLRLHPESYEISAQTVKAKANIEMKESSSSLEAVDSIEKVEARRPALLTLVKKMPPVIITENETQPRPEVSTVSR